MEYNPAIVLVEPQMGENIGGAARAALNFGLRDLRLVNPRDGWPNQVAIQNGSGAFDYIKPKIFETFEDAISDLNLVYATTARPRDMIKDVFTPAQAMKSIDAPCGIVFGRERTGLENHHIALCHGIIEIPANPDFSSLNLAQAVLVIGYEWMLRSVEPKTASYDVASHEETMNLIHRLESELEDKNFFREENLKPTMMNNIRAFMTRARMSEQEVRTFHGMISALIGNKKTGP